VPTLLTYAIATRGSAAARPTSWRWSATSIEAPASSRSTVLRGGLHDLVNVVLMLPRDPAPLTSALVEAFERHVDDGIDLGGPEAATAGARV
jgi:hypothetical protein